MGNPRGEGIVCWSGRDDSTTASEQAVQGDRSKATTRPLEKLPTAAAGLKSAAVAAVKGMVRSGMLEKMIVG